MRYGLNLDFFITRQLFLGAYAAINANFHSNICVEEGDTITCVQKKDNVLERDDAAIHQVIAGIHLGGTFF